MDVTLKLGSFPTTEVQPNEFFHHVSAADGFFRHGFRNTHFEITKLSPVTVLGESLPSPFKIETTDIGMRINPLRLFLSATKEQKKVSTSENLAALVKTEKENIVKDSENDIARVTSALARVRDKMARNASTGQKTVIEKNFDEAISLLEEEALKQGVKGYGASSTGGNVLTSAQFLRALSYSFWPMKFNRRFQIIDPQNDGKFQVYCTRGPWFFQRWARFPTEFTSLRFWNDFKPRPIPAAAKIATAEMLVKFLVQNRGLTRYMLLDTDVMADNLREIRAKLLRNTSGTEAERIKKAMNSAIAELKRQGVHVKRDYAKSWTGWTWNHTARPLGRATLFVFQSALTAAGGVFSGLRGAATSSK